ncbi:MAG: hypothetical protein HY042_13085, partial [Spirochaetia bacterium]|nr:hypothetical protein [Spirochaetia bacterium]
LYRLTFFAVCYLLLAGLLPLPYREAAVWLSLLAGAPFVALLMVRLSHEQARSEPSEWTISPQSAHHMRNGLLVAVVVLGLLGALGFMWTWSPDMFSYLQMAQDYAQGHFVVRGYWSPLMPWLLALPIRLGLDPQVSQRYLNILCAVALAAATLVLGRRYRLTPLFQVAAASVVGLVFLEYGFYPGTPDWLSAVFPTLMFVVLLREDNWDKPLRLGMLLGIFVALGYYSKHYNLLFMSAVLVGSGVLALLHGIRWRAVTTVVLVGLLLTAVLMAPWIAAIYRRYGVVTFSTTSLIARNTPTSGGIAHACIDWFLCDDPPDVLFPWEDPLARYYPGRAWSPLASMDNFQQQLNSLGSSTLVMFDQFPLGPFGVLAVCGVALGIFLLWHKPRLRFLCGWSLFVILVQVGGYIATGYMTAVYNIEFRYHTAIVPLVAVLLMWVVQSGLAWLARHEPSLASAPAFYHKHRWLLGLFLVGVILQTSNVTMYLSRLPSVQTLSSWLTTGVPRPFACDRQAAEALNDQLIPPFATTDLSHIALSFYTQKRTMGTLRWPRSEIPQAILNNYQTIGIEPPNTPAEVDAQLQQVGVKTLITVDDADLAETLVRDFHYKLAQTLTLCQQPAVVLYVPEH